MLKSEATSKTLLYQKILFTTNIPIAELIGAIATFIFSVLNIPGPKAIFFLLSFVMTTGMPVDPKEAFLRGSI